MKRCNFKLALVGVLLFLVLVPLLVACGDKDTIKVGEFIYRIDDDDKTATLVGTKYRKKGETSWPDTLEVPSEVEGYTVDGIWAAFHGCYSKKIILPNTITFINEGFKECYNLEELDIPDSVTRIIGDENFKSCPKIVQSENGFSYVDNWVVEADLNAILATLRPGTVGSCEGVSLLGLMIEGNITLPDEFCYLGQNAFSKGDGRHSSATIEGTLTVNELKDNDFALRNVKVGKLVIKKSVQDISYLLYQSSVGELVLNGEMISNIEKSSGDLNEAEKITVAGGSLSVPMLINLGCKELVIGSGVSSVCANAIKSSTIKCITVEGDAAIAPNAFARCQAVEEIRGNAALLLGMDTGHLKRLEITGGHVDAALLVGANSLESLTILPGVTLEAEALASCRVLTSATVPISALEALPKATLRHLVLSDGKVLAEGLFAGFTALESITLPEGLLSVGADAFLEAESLADVYFSGTLAQWATVSFANGAANPMAHAECLYVGGALVTEALNLAALSPYAFYGCESLAAVSLVSGVTTIPEGAFSGCVGLTSLAIPASVRQIGKNAFGGCTGLALVTFAETSGWYRYESAMATGGSVVYETYLTNPQSAAQYLTDTYENYVWKRPNV